MKSLLLTLGLFAAASAFALDRAPTTAPKPDSYPLTTCVVSGDKLDDPVKYVYKQPGKPDRVVEFCCRDCIKDFEKDPAKYVAKLDAAEKGAKPMSAAATAAAAGACCADGTAKTMAMGASCPMSGQTAAMPANCPMNMGKPAMATMTSTAAGDSCTGCEVLLQNYVPVSEALAADDLAKAKTSAAALAKQADAVGMKTIAEPARAVADASNLADARKAFKGLSTEITPLVKGAKGYVVMHCPMAQADWVQTDANVRNPYYGKMMLTCGMPKKA